MMQYNVDYGLGLTDQDHDLIAFLYRSRMWRSWAPFSNPH